MSGEDIFEKLFGKEPEVGYEFRHIQVIAGWKGVVVEWVAKGIGFGSISLSFEDKKIMLDTECSGKEFCDALIAEAVKRLEAEEAKTPPTEEELMYGYRSSNINASFLKYMYENATLGQ